MASVEGEPARGPLLHPMLGLDEVRDDIQARPVVESAVVHEGAMWDVRRDVVDLGSGVVTREFLEHTGAVAILALDDADRVLLIQQYRHPVGTRDWELPAGLLDVRGEDPLDAAARELAEEADLTARSWSVLSDVFTSPGGTSEALRIYLARDLDVVPERDRHERTDEEAGMPTGWLPLSELVEAVLTGHLHNSILCLGALAADAARQRGWRTLRPATVPFHAHPGYR